MRRGCLLVLAVVLCAGCSTLGSDQHARELSENGSDDAYCTDHGLHYPGPDYVQCRRVLVDRRLYKDWQNLHLMQRATRSGSNQTGVPASSFRSPDPASFHCHAEPQFGNDYVFCRYDDPAAVPR